MIELVIEKFKKYQETLKVEERPAESYTLAEIAEKTGISIELTDKFLTELLKEGSIETVSYIKEISVANKPIKETVIRKK